MSNNVSLPRYSSLSRRRFLYYSALAAAGAAAFPAIGKPRPHFPGSGEKLRIGCVGAGGKGSSDIQHCSTEEIVAICDADETQAADARKKHPEARFYLDWRDMLEKEHKNIDAVTVSIPDHNHAIVASSAIK